MSRGTKTARKGTSLTAAVMALSLSATLVRADEVDRYVTAFLAAHAIPGLSLAVVRDGKLLKAAGYGLANLESNSAATPETMYEIGSITKQFTAQAVMLLVQEGRLRLDDALDRHLEGLPAAWRGITLRQLLTHTSGLKDWEGEGLLSFRREYTDAEFMAAMSAFPLDFPPGDRWSYTNTAYPLLGMVVTRVSGMPYRDFVASRIFRPLGMTSTRFSLPLEIVPHRAGGYVDEHGRLGKGELLRPRVVEPNGGILSSVLDLAKWSGAFGNDVLLNRESREAITTPVRLNDGSTFNAGLGIFMDIFRGHRLTVHNGSTAGGFSSVFYHYPDDRLTVIVLCNIDRGDAVNRVATRTASFFVPGLDVRSLPARTDPDPAMSKRLLEMLRDLAAARESGFTGPDFKLSPVRRNEIGAQLGTFKRWAFLDREDAPKGARILRYKLIGDRATYYTLSLGPDGRVESVRFEDEVM